MSKGFSYICSMIKYKCGESEILRFVIEIVNTKNGFANIILHILLERT